MSADYDLWTAWWLFLEQLLLARGVLSVLTHAVYLCRGPYFCLQLVVDRVVPNCCWLAVADGAWIREHDPSRARHASLRPRPLQNFDWCLSFQKKMHTRNLDLNSKGSGLILTGCLNPSTVHQLQGWAEVSLAVPWSPHGWAPEDSAGSRPQHESFWLSLLFARSSEAWVQQENQARGQACFS